MFWTTERYGPGGVAVVGFHGELDVSTPGITVPSRVIIDLGKLEFCDSRGLKMLIQLRKHCDKQGGWLILAAPRGAVLRLFTVMNMDTQFTIWEKSPW